MKNSVFVTRKLPERGLKLIKEHFNAIVWSGEFPPTSDEIVANAKDCEGIVTLLSDPINTDLLEQLPKLRVIAQYAVGYDNIDVKYATGHGIIITNTPGVLTETTADLTWALIMATARRIVEADKYIREGNWKVAWGPELLLGIDVHEATLGIIGVGRIGSAVARRAVGFDMKVIYYNRSKNEFTRRIEEQVGAKSVDLETLLRESDIITVHVPLTRDTIRMIGRRELGMMKKDAILINTSRGAVIDERALYNALKNGKLGAAGIDVFEIEPISSTNPLLKLDNVVVVPHIGSASLATRTTMAKMCAENLISALSGNEPPNIVNPEVL